MIFKSFSWLFAIFLLVGAMGCQTDGVGPERRANLALLESDDFAVVDRDDAIANVEDATLEIPMMMNRELSHFEAKSLQKNKIF